MMIVGVRNMMMIVLLLVLYLRSVGSVCNHMVFQWTFLTLSIDELMRSDIERGRR